MKRARANRERGVAMLVLIVVLVMGAMFFVLRSLNASTMRADRYRVTQEALIQAKEALIAYAVSDNVRPGELPCPDVNDDGKLVLNEDYTASVCVSLIGRLPWITLGLPDLRDASGERLWYALSDDFHANGSVALNSDTAYRTGNTSLTVSGTDPASNAVAIVFSPGQTIRRSNGVGQSRGCTGGGCDAAGKCNAPASATAKCNVVNYLEIASGVDNSDGDTTFVSATESNTFNDRLLPILSDDVMSLVEKRAGRELAQKLRDYFDAWQNSTTVSGASKGHYPWPGSFTDPSAAAQVGVSGTQAGAIPMSTSQLVWTAAPGSACFGIGTTDITCNSTILCIFGFCIMLPGINAQVGNIGTQFADPPAAADVTVNLGLVTGPYTVTWTLNKALQRLDLSVTGGFLSAGNITVTAKAPQLNSWVTSSWLATNGWNHVSYYALSSGYAITGAQSCIAGTTCLTVTNAAAPSNDKQAVVLTTGRTLPLATPAQTARPVTTPAALSQYLELGNQNPMDRVLERNLRTPAFNDQPAIVRP